LIIKKMGFFGQPDDINTKFFQPEGF